MKKRDLLALVQRHIEDLPSPRSPQLPLQLLHVAVGLSIPNEALLRGLAGKSLPDEIVKAVKAYAAPAS